MARGRELTWEHYPCLVCGLESLCCRLLSHENPEQHAGRESRLHEGGVYGDRRASSQECALPPDTHSNTKHVQIYTQTPTDTILEDHTVNKTDEGTTSEDVPEPNKRQS